MPRKKSTKSADDVKGHTMKEPANTRSPRLKKSEAGDDVKGHTMRDPADSRLTRLGGEKTRL